MNQNIHPLNQQKIKTSMTNQVNLSLSQLGPIEGKKQKADSPSQRKRKEAWGVGTFASNLKSDIQWVPDLKYHFSKIPQGQREDFKSIRGSVPAHESLVPPNNHRAKGMLKVEKKQERFRKKIIKLFD